MSGTRQRSATTYVAWGVLAGLVLYVLSIGPAELWFEKKQRALGNEFGTMYAPVLWVAGKCPPVMDVLRWYMHLWGATAPLDP